MSGYRDHKGVVMGRHSALALQLDHPGPVTLAADRVSCHIQHQLVGVWGSSGDVPAGNTRSAADDARLHVTQHVLVTGSF